MYIVLRHGATTCIGDTALGYMQLNYSQNSCTFSRRSLRHCIVASLHRYRSRTESRPCRPSRLAQSCRFPRSCPNVLGLKRTASVCFVLLCVGTLVCTGDMFLIILAIRGRRKRVSAECFVVSSWRGGKRLAVVCVIARALFPVPQQSRANA